jgi:uncharacterized protein YdeI (YjbR/CyaY-like superfamily)
MNKPNPSVDGFLRKSAKWREELQALRRILLDSPLVEEVKWRVPCYTFNGKNVVILGRFKDNCVLSFVKGALLKDGHGLLLKPGENTQSARVIRFTDVQQIVGREAILRAYVQEAIAVEQAGLQVKFKEASEFNIPEEFQARLDESPGLARAFAALTPGRQRAYLLYFSGAKQSKTRAARVEKWVEPILNGKGLED